MRATCDKECFAGTSEGGGGERGVVSFFCFFAPLKGELVFCWKPLKGGASSFLFLRRRVRAPPFFSGVEGEVQQEKTPKKRPFAVEVVLSNADLGSNSGGASLVKQLLW